MNQIVQDMVLYALSFLGKPYLWGGNGPQGFDCSGFVQEVLASAGLDPSGDQSAQALFDILSMYGKVFSNETPAAGDIIFYGTDSKSISHVAFMINSWQQIGANGGNHTCTDLRSAEKLGAMVKVRPWNYRKDFVAFVRIKEFQ